MLHTSGERRSSFGFHPAAAVTTRATGSQKLKSGKYAVP